MRRKVSLIKSLDWWTILLYLILAFLGWINIYAAVYNEEHQSIFDITQRYGKQLVWIGASFFIALVILIIDGKFFSAFSYPIYLLMILLLIAVLIFGKEVHGARSWFQFGAVRFQPAEFAKFATSLALAQYISQYNFKMHRLKSLLKIGLILFIPALLILLQNDAGSALVYTVFVVVLYREGLSGLILFLGILAAGLFVATLIYTKLTLLLAMLILAIASLKIFGTRFKTIGIAMAMLLSVFGLVWVANKLFDLHYSYYQLLLITIGLNLIPFIILIYRKKLWYAYLVILFFTGGLGFTFSVGYIFDKVLEPHQQKRINELLGIESDPFGVGYNVNQSKIAIGSGGWNGKGFLQGTQTKFNFVPEQSTDFIFCTVGEEWGFIGTSSVILLFLMLIMRLLYLAERQRSSFSRIYGYGVASILIFHVAINIGMTIGLLPVIGIPLPFFSYGGSSLWSFTILLFIFLRLDAHRLELLR